MEGVLGPAAVRLGVGERADHVEELGERARVGVQEQQRRRVLERRADVDEVDGLAVDLGQEVRARRSSAPPGRASRTSFQRSTMSRQVGVRGAVLPVVAGGGLGVAACAPGGCCRSSRSASGIVTVKGRMLGVLVGGHAATVEAVQERFVPTIPATFGGFHGGHRGPDAGPARPAPGPRPTGPAPSSPHRLGVTDRTVRNDIDRLRGLGYPVDAVRGPGGRYRLGVGAKLPPLLLDDDEAVAVAVGLRAGTADHAASRRPAPGRWPSSSTCSPTGSSAGSTRSATR